MSCGWSKPSSVEFGVRKGRPDSGVNKPLVSWQPSTLESKWTKIHSTCSASARETSAAIRDGKCNTIMAVAAQEILRLQAMLDAWIKLTCAT